MRLYKSLRDNGDDNIIAKYGLCGVESCKRKSVRVVNGGKKEGNKVRKGGTKCFSFFFYVSTFWPLVSHPIP